MDVFDLLSKSDDDHPIRKFSGYKIIGKGGESGQQGIVLKAINDVGKIFAIKFARPKDEDQRLREKSSENFKREIKILASLHHRNIARIVTGGSACWQSDVDKSEWEIFEGFENDNTNTASTSHYTFFYIMEFIEQDLINVFGPLSDDSSEDMDNGDLSSEHTRLFEELATQICAAMTHYHLKEVTHKDIKADNIRFAPEDGSFILVDFGFAGHLASQTENPEVLVVKEMPDFIAEIARQFTLMDIAQFAGVVDIVFQKVKHLYDGDRVNGIQRVLDKARSSKIENRFNSSIEFYDALCPYFMHLGRAHLPFVIRINEFLTPSLFGRFESKIRLPVSGSILLSKEVRRIIDTKEFQRLRGVRQLGPTMFVFPGATHTRFEHSLGVYWLALRYLERISRSPNFRALHTNQDEPIKLVILAALLHDIGHYPYSHWVEELGLTAISFPSHERRAAERIINSEIGKLIREDWGINHEDVANIIDKVHTPLQHLTLNSIIDSAIDVDKLDYLIRDSIHCGVDYGKGIDVERLLDALYVHPDDKRLYLTDKGRSILISILGARNIMYQEVYWHKTVRACQAMFKRFFYEYIEREIRPISQIRKATLLTDEVFLNYLFNKINNNSPLRPLLAPFVFKGRELYKAAFVYSPKQRTGEAVKSFFSSLLGRRAKYNTVVEKSNLLASSLGINDLELLIETVPVKAGERYELDHFKIVEHRSLTRGTPVLEGLDDSIKNLNDYLDENKRAFVFCSRNHYARLRSFTPEDWNDILKDIQ